MRPTPPQNATSSPLTASASPAKVGPRDRRCRRYVLTAAEDAALREALKRCSPATYAAARQFRETGNRRHLPAIVGGMIERFVDREQRAKLNPPDERLRLAEDLGLDSLTMMEL